MIDHISVSQIDRLKRCMKSWEWRYIYKIPDIPSGPMILGRAYDKTVSNFLECKKVTGACMPQADIEDSYATIWDHQLTTKETYEDDEQIEFEQIIWDDDPGRLKDVGIKLSLQYCNTIGPKINPIKIQEKEVIIINDIPIERIPDVVTETKVIDHKVKKRRFSEIELASNIQPTVYLIDRQVPMFEYHVALDQKVPSIETNIITRSNDDINFFKDNLVTYWRLIEQGLFPPTGVGTWLCAEGKCSYYSRCAGKKS